jgi:hypothetical protein
MEWWGDEDPNTQHPSTPFGAALIPHDDRDALSEPETVAEHIRPTHRPLTPALSHRTGRGPG